MIERLEEFVVENRFRKEAEYDFELVKEYRKVTMNDRKDECFGRLYNSFGSKKANRGREETVFEFEFKKKLQVIRSYFEEDLSKEMILRKIRELVLKKFFDFLFPLQKTEILDIFTIFFSESQKYFVELEKELDSRNPFLLAAVDVRNLKPTEIPLFSSNILDSLQLEKDDVKKDKLFSAIWFFWEKFFVSAKKKVRLMTDFDLLKEESYWEHEMSIGSICKGMNIKQNKQSAQKILALVDHLSALKVKTFIDGKMDYFVLFPRFRVDLNRRKAKFFFHPVALCSSFWAATIGGDFFQEYVSGLADSRESKRIYRTYGISVFLLLLFAYGDKEIVSKKELGLPAKIKDEGLLKYMIKKLNTDLEDLSIHLDYNPKKNCIEKRILL